MRPLELYIHIPFCISKCKYCDFLSAPSKEGERQEYVKSLCKRIRSYRTLAEAYHVVSIFIGGGTPSLLVPAQVFSIFDAVRETFMVDKDAEITIEMNPGTVSPEKLIAYRQVGISRLSIGLQSVRNEELKVLGRIHTFEDFLHTYEMARREGFGNINIDLMSGIPFQTLDGWKESLEKVAGLGTEHISAYSLIIEEGTPFYERYRDARHEEELPDEETERQMYHFTREILGAYGYRRYEISNYAKEGFECRHNLGYWNRTEYLGIGTGAASLIGSRRWSEGEEPGELSWENQMEEYMFLGLRKMEGVTKSGFLKEFGCTMESKYSRVLKRMYAEGLIETESERWRKRQRKIL